MSPEAITLPADLAEIERYPDLLNEVGGNFQYISDSSGLIEVTNYFTTTTATDTLPGSVRSFVSSTAVMRGDLGVPVLQQGFTYYVQSGGSSTITPIASRTTYPNTTARPARRPPTPIRSQRAPRRSSPSGRRSRQCQPRRTAPARRP